MSEIYVPSTLATYAYIGKRNELDGPNWELQTQNPGLADCAERLLSARLRGLVLNHGGRKIHWMSVALY